MSHDINQQTAVIHPSEVAAQISGFLGKRVMIWISCMNYVMMDMTFLVPHGDVW